MKNNVVRTVSYENSTHAGIMKTSQLLLKIQEIERENDFVNIEESIDISNYVSVDLDYLAKLCKTNNDCSKHMLYSFFWASENERS